ncbi:nodal homolog 2-A-like [Discoglossus pictus]
MAELWKMCEEGYFEPLFLCFMQSIHIKVQNESVTKALSWKRCEVGYFELVALFKQGIPITPESKRMPFPGYKLGLKASTTHHGKKNSQDIKYPHYMTQLYKSLIMGNDAVIPILERPVLQDSDAVLSLIAKDYAEVDNRWTLAFDMSSVSSSNDLRLAELRINLPSFQRSQKAKVEIYHTKEGQESHFLGYFITSPSSTQSSWKVFNLTKMLQGYLQQGDKFANGEYIKAEDMPDRAQDTSSRAGKDESHNTHQHYGHLTPKSRLTDEKVIMVIFSKDRPSANFSDSFSLIKTVESSKYVTKQNVTMMANIGRHRRNRDEQHSIIMNNIQPRPVYDGKPLCRRVDMYVDFAKTEWNNQIIHPKRFNAYRCEGACPIPLDVTFKPTNHAYIKSLVKLYDNERVECPSCVPVKMSSLSMLHYENDTAVLKHHEDMIVEECGCH